MPARWAGATVPSVIRGGRPLGRPETEGAGQMANETNPSWVGRPQTSGPAAGFILFAATMMILIGIFHVIDGLVALLDDKSYFWSIIAVTIGVFVIWAVAAHGRELRDASF
jgi:hypothetical protein